MKIFAHRGVSALAPENTMKAFQLALDHGADGIEFDVFQHASDFIVIHDQWLERTTTGTGSIYQLSPQQLKKLDAGEGQDIPYVEQLVGLVGGRCELNFELKGLHDHRQFCTLLDWALTQGFTEKQLLVSSFNHHWLFRIKQHRPQTRIAALIAHYPLDFTAEAQRLGAQNIHIDINVVDHALVEDAHRRNMGVLVYTVDRAETLRQLASWGVDGVFSNNPLQARAYLDSQLV
ncbi:glycerophosphodiester phosphodiesterase [Aestuariibacter salexigens]|uniref:glycerophosphodiester phosphodiesterase n=1 Tax=Aestuariibacter salexigens TaxID=226010 RepID=UPI00040C95A7|nr:glycerophosphodiester phosphodiesterase family protein [Aestuariibacter salexigens]